MDFEIGQVVDHYEVVALIGSGGMGDVYSVRHTISDRIEAMKVLLPDLRNQPELAERFLREIKIQARLSHPNIAQLYAAQRSGNQLLMFMEMVEGTSLHDRIQQGPMELSEALGYIIQILSALDYAHERGVTHRDIKPRNILVTGAGVVKLTDFGIAMMQSDKQLTKTGATVGSLYYMSPEQVNGSHGDARSDLYSTGVLLYEMACGVRPIRGDSEFAIMAAHVHQTPVPPIDVNPKLPVLFSRAAMKALAKDPEGRFQSAREFKAVLEMVRSGQASSALDTTTTSIRGAANAAAGWDPAVLEKVRKDFAAFIGPMARIIVERFAKKAQTVDQLYSLLAAEIPSEIERAKFLATKRR